MFEELFAKIKSKESRKAADRLFEATEEELNKAYLHKDSRL